VKVGRNESGAGALNLMRAGLHGLTGEGLIDDGGCLGLDGDGLEARFARFEHFAAAGDRAARADSGDEDVDLAIGVAQSSSAVVFDVMAGLAGFSNCCGIQAFGVLATSSVALAMAPFMPLSAGVSTRSAPSSASSVRRSRTSFQASSG
jgi:hypothetical protein